MKSYQSPSVGKPTHGRAKVAEGHKTIFIGRAGAYVTRNGNSHGPTKKRHKTKTGVTYVPPVHRPRWARKYEEK